jgi:hypothetical protein
MTLHNQSHVTIEVRGCLTNVSFASWVLIHNEAFSRKGRIGNTKMKKINWNGQGQSTSGEISLVDQDKILYVSVANLKFIIKLPRFFFPFLFTFILCNFLVWTLQYFFGNLF